MWCACSYRANCPNYHLVVAQYQQQCTAQTAAGGGGQCNDECREAVEVLTAGMHMLIFPDEHDNYALAVVHTLLSHTSVTVLVKQHSSGIPVQRKS